VFLEGGRITARGPHQELLQTHQPYADLVTAYERAEAEREFEGEFDDADFEGGELKGNDPDDPDFKDSDVKDNDFDEENAA
jgi:hypothetical protein